MKRFFSLVIVVLMFVGIFLNMPTVKAADASELFSVTTDGFNCNGTITYTVHLKQGISFSGASIRFKYDTSLLDVQECEPFMTEDSFGDPVENISGIYESGKISGLSGVHGIIFMYGGEEDYSAKSSDKAFVQITFRLKDDVLSPFSPIDVNFSCYEFISYTKPQLNIFKGNEKEIATISNKPNDHNFVNNICSSCDCLCFEYESNANGITITKYNGRKGNFEVPASLDSFSVTAIGNGTEPICHNFINIKIPDTVKKIGSNAFSGTEFYENPNNWKNGALYIDNFLIDTNESLPTKYYINDSIIIANGAFDKFSGYILCEKGSSAHNYAAENDIKFILPTISPADSLTEVDFPHQLIFTSVLLCNDEKNIISIPETVNVTAELNGSYFGTGSTITVFDGDDYMGDYTLIATGDLNGDGVCDVLDGALASLYSCESKTPSTYEIYAANGEIAEEIDVSDYQNVVNIALQ